jgi:DNA replication licensing factor MCM2
LIHQHARLTTLNASDRLYLLIDAIPEAEEAPEEEDFDDHIDGDEEEDDGEDLMENAARDYQRIEALDTYGTEDIDDRAYESMTAEERAAAEMEIARRSKGGRNDGFYGLLDAMETEEDEDARRDRRTFGRGDAEDEGDETDEDDLDREDPMNLEAFDVPLREWIAQDQTRREIQRKFRAFLHHFTAVPEDTYNRRRRGNGIYEQKIRAMCAANFSTLQVSYQHLMDSEPVLAYWLCDAPKDMLELLNTAATVHTLSLFPSYKAIKSQIHVRISDLPVSDSLRDLRRQHLDNFVKVHGVITRRSAVFPQLQLAYYQCMACKRTQGPFRVEGVGNNSQPPDSCSDQCESSHFKLHPTMSVYCNVQRVNLQETPGSVPPGRVPRTKEVLLSDDLIDVARPGEEVEVTGVYENTFDGSLTIKSGFPVFSTFISANHVTRKEDASSASNLSESDIRQILELSRDPNIGQRIASSIAPSIFGHENCKMALAMSLFGGVPKNVNDKHRIRGDVNGTYSLVAYCLDLTSHISPSLPWRSPSLRRPWNCKVSALEVRREDRTPSSLLHRQRSKCCRPHSKCPQGSHHQRMDAGGRSVGFGRPWRMFDRRI